MVKILLGYLIVYGPLLGFLAVFTRVPLGRLAVPFFVQLVPTVIFVLVIHNVRKPNGNLRNQSYWISLAALIYFMCASVVFAHYGVKFGFMGPDHSTDFLWSAIPVSFFIAGGIFFNMRKKAIRGEVVSR